MGLNDSIDSGANNISLIIFIAVFTGVLLLTLVLIFGPIRTVSVGPSTPGNVVEAGWLNSTGYTLEESSRPNFGDVVIINVTKISDGTPLSPGNYTLVGNKIYNNTELVC